MSTSAGESSRRTLAAYSDFTTGRTMSAGALDSLITREAPGLLAYFARRVTPATDAADLLGETLLVLWRRVEDMPTDSDAARMWMYGVARRVLATHRRTTTRRKALTDKLRAELQVSTPNPDADDDRVSHLKEAIAALKPLDQEIVRLVHWEGFSLAEVATLLGKRQGTVRSRYHRARTELKTRMTARDAQSPAHRQR
ncbi:MAG TPA: sigma-70 family RNA polymerase sigma factor [Spirillospora sp.]|nr:sigma-70 family RNA polymerase sigma factor [Spirillospora sp.]